MRRRVFTLASALSALLCLAAVMLWVWSYRAHSRAGLSTSEARYTLHSDRGRLTLTGPPNRGPQDALARQMAARISNDDVLWEPLSRSPGAGGTFWYSLQSHIRRKSDTWAMYLQFDCKGGMQSAGMKSAARPLLMALEDPRRAVAAHHELTFLRQGSSNEPAKVHGDRVTVYVDGLPIIFGLSDFPVGIQDRNPDDFWTSHGPVGHADPSTWRAIRDMWHDRLDVRIASLAYGWLVAAAAVLPLLWLLRFRKERKAARRGLCGVCGYDLRATADRCPECGTPAISTKV